MHAKRDSNKHKKALIAGSIALLVVIVILVAILVSSCSKDGKFEDLYNEGAVAYSKGDFKTAAEKLEKALDYGESVDCYVLLANTYYAGLDNIDKAMEVLYKASSKIDNETIDDYLEKLKAIKAKDDPGADVVQIGTETISPDVTSLVLNQMRLQNEDIAPLSELKKLESLSLTDNALTDLSIVGTLSKLNFLQLGNNQISDISPLRNLTELKTLYLDGNPISDFTPLYDLKKLTTLSLKNTGITPEQVAELELALPECSIHCERGEISDVVEIELGGVRFMSDVTELDLSGKGITDISPLEKCVKLQKLDLRDNKIKDLTPLMDLSELSWLCLWNNQVEDILPLMGMENLKYLDADKNLIKDITAVSGMAALEELWLSYNELDSIKPLLKMTTLQRLGLKGTNLTDETLAELEGMASLKELCLEDNTALTGEAVDKLKAALPDCTITHSDLVYILYLGDSFFKSDSDTVSASGTGINSIIGLERFKNLKTLTLTNTSVSDLTPLAGLGIETLEIWSSDPGLPGQLTSLEPLRGITTLRNVNLMWNSVADLSPLAGSTGIAELHLSGNKVSDLSPLSGMTGLQGLTLDYCPIGDISVLANLTGLRELSLQQCSIREISALAGLSNLRELYLDGNNISDLSPLESLQNLNYLYISGNNLSAEQVLRLQEALPNCNIYTDLDLTAEAPAEEDAQ